MERIHFRWRNELKAAGKPAWYARNAARMARKVPGRLKAKGLILGSNTHGRFLKLTKSVIKAEKDMVFRNRDKILNNAKLERMYRGA